jgi:hypothetical protein
MLSDSSASSLNKCSDPENILENGTLVKDSFPGISYYDHKDEVYRCGACGFEMWRPPRECEGCGAGEPAYYEVINLEQEKDEDCYPGITCSLNYMDGDIDSESRHDMTGEYLDGVSAYSSTRSPGPEEYEINGFIDAPIHEDGETDHQDRDGHHFARRGQHGPLCDKDMQPDVIGPNFDSYNSSELNIEITNRDVQGPLTSRLVISPVLRDSWAAMISASGVKTRTDAFFAATNGDGHGWHCMSLMSLGDNHTLRELEL